MIHHDKTEQGDFETLQEAYHSHELRLNQIEKQLASLKPGDTEFHAHKPVVNESETAIGQEKKQEEFIATESIIGEYGLAWIGSIVLVLGIAFLMVYSQNRGFSILSSSIGFGAVAIVFIGAYMLRKSFSYLSLMLYISGFILVYYTVLKLYFFTPQALIPWEGIDIALLLLSIGALLYFSVKRNSEIISCLGIVLLLVSALIFDSAHVTLTLITATAALALFFFYRYSWWRLFLLSIFLVYIAHMIWLRNNPLIGHQGQAIDLNLYSMLYLYAVGLILSLAVLVRQNDKIPDHAYIFIVFWNAFGFSIAILYLTNTYFSNNYVGIFSAITAYCLLYSVLLKLRTERRLAAAFFACFGFFALSIALYGYFMLPDVYYLLALESVLVISLALWFRSQIIVVANALLFLSILIFYLVSTSPVGGINLMFAFVALASARILNWKKEGLTLKTDVLRNLYLVIAFFTVLYGLYHAVPGQYITLSWSMAAVGYFLMSILLHNIKYRWMAILTIIASVIYLFIVDLASLDIRYRVAAFLFLAIISLSVSIFYTKWVKKKTQIDS